MAAVASAAPNASSSSALARALSITTTAAKDSPSSAFTPTSSGSPTSVSTPTSSGSTVPPIAIRPSTTNKPLPAMSPATGSHMAATAAASPVSTGQPKSLSMTSKEWVIPPRPKPGRKPATDTPPTKRKAQNRAAQRAFRERRAARVGELEEQLEEEKLAHDRAVRELQERISHLEIETQTLQSKCQWLESMLEKERQNRESLGTNWNDQRQPSTTTARNGSMVSVQARPQTGPAGLPQKMGSPHATPPRDDITQPIAVAQPRPIHQPFSISHLVSPPEEANGVVDLTCGSCHTNGACACAEEVLKTVDIPMGCGNCSLERCGCLEETIHASLTASDLKRPLPPSSPPSTSPDEKRQRSDTGLAMETDFTAMFSTQGNKDHTAPAFLPTTQPQSQGLASLEVRDPCGFCKDGTYCVCADSMVSSASVVPSVAQQVPELTQTRTPPPSEDDVGPMPMEVTATGAIKLPGPRSSQQRRPATNTTLPKSPAKASSSCGPNGPGTCAQCLADPKSGLFCRSLAANFEKNNSGGTGGCCGGGGPGGCCRAGEQSSSPDGSGTDLPLTRPAGSANDTAGNSSGLGLSLSCADAYKTLASHRHFNEAADDIGSWLPKLKALPIPRPGGDARGHGAGGGGGRGHGSGAGRAPIEVEAASIMSVLKDFDVRFGRGE